MEDNELQIITQLTGVPSDQIRLANDGFWSRGYVIDNGRVVFKFKKSPEVSYQTEIKSLNFVNSLGLNINLQKVGWTSPDDTYLGVYGVIGKSLENLHNYDRAHVAAQLASALHKLHQSRLAGAEVIPLAEEITAWQHRYQRSHDILPNYFSASEIARLDNFVFHLIPEKLSHLSENIVLSHGDLGDGNIFVDDDGKVGIIDFNEMCYLDEAADFMDVSDHDLYTAMLDAYGADETLREKVRLRVLVRPLFVLGDYAKRGDTSHTQSLVAKIQTLLATDFS